MNKNYLLALGLIGTIVFLVSIFSVEMGVCPQDNYSACLDISNQITETALPLVALFVFSLITYRLPDAVYKAWMKFAVVWVPLSILVVVLSPEYSTDFLYGIDKGGAAFLTSVIFVVISVVIIGYNYLSTRSK